MSPRYETAHDRINEEDVAKIFCLNMNCTHRKIREIDDYSPDVSFWRDGRRVAVGEIKCRKYTKDRFQTYLISANKVDSLIERWHPTPIFLIVRWTDRIGWIRLTESDALVWTQEIAGRKDRDEPKDQEFCYMIPIRQFKRLKMDGLEKASSSS
jgi:hypothetical protein